MEALQRLETALETEHARFVRVSQLSSLVAARLDPDNPEGSMAVRRQLDAITQQWDNLVTRIDEHSQTVH